MIRIEFDGGVIELREPNRHERVAAMDIRYEIDALANDAMVPREMFERAEATLLEMVVMYEHDGGSVVGDAAREEVREAGIFLSEGLTWLQAVTFRTAGKLVAQNGNLGSGGHSSPVEASGAGVSQA